jgi:hypothetical protein
MLDEPKHAIDHKRDAQQIDAQATQMKRSTPCEPIPEPNFPHGVLLSKTRSGGSRGGQKDDGLNRMDQQIRNK